MSGESSIVKSSAASSIAKSSLAATTVKSGAASSIAIGNPSSDPSAVPTVYGYRFNEQGSNLLFLLNL